MRLTRKDIPFLKKEIIKDCFIVMFGSVPLWLWLFFTDDRIGLFAGFFISMIGFLLLIYPFLVIVQFIVTFNIIKDIKNKGYVDLGEFNGLNDDW